MSRSPVNTGLSQEDIDRLFQLDGLPDMEVKQPPAGSPKAKPVALDITGFRLRSRSETYGLIECPECGLRQEPVIVFFRIRRPALDCRRCGLRIY